MEESAPAGTEAELEAFRRKWREEVSARNQKPANEQIKTQPESSKTQKQKSPNNAHLIATRKGVVDYSEEIEPRAYHDLPDKEELLQLGLEGQNHDRDALNREPVSALEHYERAVEKETQGHLGDSMRHYRKAFKLDDGVHEAYKRKHFPPSSFVKPKPASNNPSNTSALQQPMQGNDEVIPATLKQLIDEFSTLRIEPPEPPTDASPPERCAVAELPEEILSNVLLELAVVDVACFARMAQVCKRLAYLVMTEESIWKRISLGSEFGLGAMRYEYACDVEGNALSPPDLLNKFDLNPPIRTDSSNDPEEAPASLNQSAEYLLHSSYASSWRQMFRSRPRIRFGGCYISTVNYTRAGATSTNTLTWGAPVHVVTYFRYLRFFRDGSVISLLTTSEPVDVVHHLIKANMHSHHHAGSMLPSVVMKDALKGRWRLSSVEEDGDEGDLFVETQGVVPKYTYKLHLALAHAGKGARNNKLAWKGFWSYNKLTDDLATFEMRHARAYYWSRVKSYGEKGE